MVTDHGICCHPLPRLRKFLDRGTRWRLWSWSTAPGTEPIWDLRFRKAARALHERVGQPTEDVHHEEPGIVQAFDGVSGDDAWVVCALPYSEPTLVAKPVWEALRQAGARTPSGAMTQLGFPVGDKREREFGYRLRDRIVPADATRWSCSKARGGQDCCFATTSAKPGAGSQKRVSDPYRYQGNGPGCGCRLPNSGCAQQRRYRARYRAL